MSLTEADVATMREVIFDAFEVAMNPRFDVLEADVAEIKQDVRVLKDDVRTLKEDVHVLKQDMREVKTSLHNLEGRVEAIESDVKELYGMIADMQKETGAARKFAKMTLEGQMLKVYADFQALAKDAGITLPH